MLIFYSKIIQLINEEIISRCSSIKVSNCEYKSKRNRRLEMKLLSCPSQVQVQNPKSKVQRKGTVTIILQATRPPPHHHPPITFLSQNVNPVMGKDHHDLK